jgi:hypothetical protein
LKCQRNRTARTCVRYFGGDGLRLTCQHALQEYLQGVPPKMCEPLMMSSCSHRAVWSPPSPCPLPPLGGEGKSCGPRDQKSQGVARSAPPRGGLGIHMPHALQEYLQGVPPNVIHMPHALQGVPSDTACHPTRKRLSGCGIRQRRGLAPLSVPREVQFRAPRSFGRASSGQRPVAWPPPSCPGIGEACVRYVGAHIA